VVWAIVGAYARAIGGTLAAAGFDDMPRRGPRVLLVIANYGGSAGDMTRELGPSEQAASQLLDNLVARGYAERQLNLDGRRGMTIELTDRGRAAATAVRVGLESVDAELARLLPPADQAAVRARLAVLDEWRAPG
jgi:DNA-binding MarR family transcriptional regulator